MTVLKERQLEAWEERLRTYPHANLFLSHCDITQAQAVWEKSYEWTSGHHDKEMIHLQAARDLVLAKLPTEVYFLSFQEHSLLERLLANYGKTELYDWEEAGAAESLVRRLWCSIEVENDIVILYLPVDLHEALSNALDTKEHHEFREKIFRFDATVHGLLYIVGYLGIEEPLERFLKDVAQRDDAIIRNLALRYFKASYDYVLDEKGHMILIHPGLAEPEPVIYQLGKSGLEVIELSPEMMLGAMNGILPEEVDLNRDMVASLIGNIRPEYNAADVAQDLRLLAKQGAPFEAMKEVLESVFAGLPTKSSLKAMEVLKTRTPSWYGLSTMTKH